MAGVVGGGGMNGGCGGGGGGCCVCLGGGYERGLWRGDGVAGVVGGGGRGMNGGCGGGGGGCCVCWGGGGYERGLHEQNKTLQPYDSFIAHWIWRPILRLTGRRGWSTMASPTTLHIGRPCHVITTTVVIRALDRPEPTGATHAPPPPCPPGHGPLPLALPHPLGRGVSRPRAHPLEPPRPLPPPTPTNNTHQPRPTHPPIHIRKIFLRQKMKYIKGAGNLRPVLGTQTFFS